VGHGSRVTGQGKIVAIVPAAGMGKRFGSEKNKPFHLLHGIPLFIWPLKALAAIPEIEEIIPVVKEQDLMVAAELIENYQISKIKRIVPGGKERQDSVYNAIKILDEGAAVVLIHDGVRPLIDEDLIRRVLDGLQDCDGAVAAVPVKDTIKEARRQKTEDRQTDKHTAEGRGEIIVEKTLNRSLLWAIQTPQAFHFNKIREVYEKAMADKYYATDDAALIERYGGTVKIVMGSYRNIKITTPEDILIAEAMLKGG
jgi:2-C-methyl-D-erythritol 4-phosphate cytidylyltransferase